MAWQQPPLLFPRLTVIRLFLLLHKDRRDRKVIQAIRDRKVIPVRKVLPVLPDRKVMFPALLAVMACI